MKKRVASMILVLSMVSALLALPVSAAYVYSRDTSARDSLTQLFSSGSWDAEFLDAVNDVIPAVTGVQGASVATKWSIVNWVFDRCKNTYGNYGAVSYSQLQSICDQFNSNFRKTSNESALYYYLSGHMARGLLNNFGSTPILVDGI